MIKFENTEVLGWEHAIRGMRNPMNSWEKSDSFNVIDDCKDKTNCRECEHWDVYKCKNIGPNDHDLMMRLAKGGPVHAKYRRMIAVYVDITAPLYWWKEFDTYKVGTVANSCSTMHKIAAKEFTLEDFSTEHLFGNEDMLKWDERTDIAKDHTLAAVNVDGDWCYFSPKGYIQMTCNMLNRFRQLYLETKDKKYWWQIIQLLPSSYNQKRTVMLNYEVLANIYASRKNHKLDEWSCHELFIIGLCDWIETLPYSEIITGGKSDKNFEKPEPVDPEKNKKELNKILEDAERIKESSNRRLSVRHRVFKNLKRYTIDYGCGIAYLDTPFDPVDRFCELANTCFGIRKSITKVNVKETAVLSDMIGYERLEFDGDVYIWNPAGARRMIQPMEDKVWNNYYCESCEHQILKGEVTSTTFAYLNEEELERLLAGEKIENMEKTASIAFNPKAVTTDEEAKKRARMTGKFGTGEPLC